MAVIERIIKASSQPNEVVLDPFIGSGTTAVVALALQRSVIGFELKKEYCDIAAQRIESFFEQQKI